MPPVPPHTIGATEGYHHFLRPNVRYSGRRAALLRRAVVEMLVRNEVGSGVPWTHKVDQTFNEDGGRTLCAVRIRYGAALAALPALLAPSSAWMVIEKHPHGTGHHMHGVWKAIQAATVPQWWRGVKEWCWDHVGSCRMWRLNGDPSIAARMVALAYPLKHAVKGSPTTFNRKATWYNRREYADGSVVIRWEYRGSWWTAERSPDGSLETGKDV